MKDPITTAYVIKGAVQAKKFHKFVQAVGQGEIEAMQYLIAVADILETQYEKRNSDDFDHVVFAYEVAEPFGAKVAKVVAKAGNMISTPYIEHMANGLLDAVSRPARSPEAQRIEYDKQCGSSADLEDYYQGINRQEHPMFPTADWRFGVANGHTIDGYWDWVYNCVHNWEEPQ